MIQEAFAWLSLLFSSLINNSVIFNQFSKEIYYKKAEVDFWICKEFVKFVDINLYPYLDWCKG